MKTRKKLHERSLARAEAENTKPDKATWTFLYTTGGEDRRVEITARTLTEADEIFDANFGAGTSRIIL